MNPLLKKIIKEENLPRLVGCSAKGFTRRNILEAKKYGVIAFELRLDLLQKEYPSTFEKILNKNLRILEGERIIFTVRSKREGGYFQGTKTEKEQLYSKYLTNTFAVDIEIVELSQCENLLSEIKKQGKILIASYHNFNIVPPLKNLQQLICLGKKYQADIIKFAVFADRLEQIIPLLQLQYEEKEIPLSLMTMGNTALFSRILFANLGSIFTYSAMGKPTAPNQPTCMQIYKYTKMFFPEKK